MSKRKPSGYWTPERIDRLFNKKMEELERTPKSTELPAGWMSALERGRYLSQVTRFNDYLRYRGIEINHEIGKWIPKKVDEVFDKKRQELGRVPTQNELSFGWMSSIKKGKYHPQIIRFNDYLIHRGLEVNRASGKWTNSEEMDEEFDRIKKKLGRTPKSTELPAGWMSALERGRYLSQVTRFNDYLKHRGLKINLDAQRWSIPAKIDEVFDRIKKELGSVPKKKDLPGGLVNAIMRRKYHPEITKLSEYLTHRGLNSTSQGDVESLLESYVNGGTHDRTELK